jgi:hypothetical protein
MKEFGDTAEVRSPGLDRGVLALAEIAARAKEAAKAQAAAFDWDPFARSHTVDCAAIRPAEPERRAPLNVILADPHKSLFDGIRDPRLAISELAGARTDAPDVLVLNASSAKRMAQNAAAVPDQLWRHLARTGGVLVFDASGEGAPHDPVRTKALHDFLRDKGLDPALAAYVTQARDYPADYGVCCDALGVGDRRMSVWLYDRFIQMTVAPFHNAGEAHFNHRLGRYAGAERARSRRYICFNNVMRPHRAVFLLGLLQQGLFDKGFVSMGLLGEDGQRLESGEALISSMRSWSYQGAPDPGLLVLLDESLPFVDELLQRGADYIALDTSKSEANLARIEASEIKECADSWFTVVSETDFSDRLHRITEKPFKPLLNFHPFVLLGNVGSLRLIRAYGFQTYPGFFDERYDEEPDARTRLEMIHHEVDRLCRMDEAELARLDEAAAATAVFNAWWGLVELPRLFRSRIDTALVDSLLSLGRSSPPGG